MSEENQNAEAAENQTEETVDSTETKESTDSTGSAENNENQEQQKEPTDAEKIAALEKENAELLDVFISAKKIDNYRKRMLKEKQDTFDYANANLLGDLLESLDNFDRTVEASKNATDAKSIADGIKMINKNLVKMLEDKYNLVSYGKPGDAFNPDEHEALRSEEGKVKEPEIKEVYLKGYKLKEKIIRHAKVLVTMPVSE